MIRKVEEQLNKKPRQMSGGSKDYDKGATSGEFKVTFLDKDNKSLSYAYTVKAGDNVRDIIPLDPDTLGDNWVLVMEKNEDTDASLKYVMK